MYPALAAPQVPLILLFNQAEIRLRQFLQSKIP